MKIAKSLIAFLPFIFLINQQAYSSEIISGCVMKRFGLLRIVDSPSDCRRRESPISWNVEGPAGPEGPTGAEGPEGPAGPSQIGAVAVLQSIGGVATPTGGPSVEIPGLATTISVGDGSLLWVQGDFHEHRYCDDYQDGSYTTESWALDLEVDGVIVASREMRGDQGNLYNHESKPFTWVSDSLPAGDYSVRFLLRSPPLFVAGTLPNQALVCLGTDTTPERQSRVVVLELPR